MHHNNRILEDDPRFLELDKYIYSHADTKGISLNVLQKAQDLFGYLPLEVHKHIADKLDVPIAELYGVTTFYSQFSTEPKGEHKIQVCLGTVCYVQKAQDVLNELTKELEIKVDQTTSDLKFTLEGTRCLGCCSLAPVMMIDEDVYANISDLSTIKPILEKYRKVEEHES